MPSATVPPEELLAVIDQYRSRQRLVTGLLVGLVFIPFLAVYAWQGLLPAAVVAIGMIVLLRAPILRPRGTARIRTADDPETVADVFTGPRPPLLAFQWGLADVITTDKGTTYTFTDLFGRRQTEMTVNAQRTSLKEGQIRIDLSVTADGAPWGTYTVTIGADGEQTTVTIEYTADRRFGLRRLPQQVLMRRYQPDALAAQGYTILERDAHFGR